MAVTSLKMKIFEKFQKICVSFNEFYQMESKNVVFKYFEFLSDFPTDVTPKFSKLFSKLFEQIWA